MSFRPTGYTTWASAATNIAEPTDAKKSVGWSINEQPPSSYFNWLERQNTAWINYFDWTTSLRPVVDEDFVRAIASGGGSGILTPLWTNSSGAWQLTEASDAPGAMQLFNGLAPSVNYDWYTRVGSLNDRDFRLEVHAKMPARAVGTTGLFFFGAIGHYGFVATGPSTPYGFVYTPSGRNPTAVSLNVDPQGASYLKLVAERHGPTIGLFVNDVLKASIPGVMMGATGMLFGGRYLSASVLDTVNCSVDRVGLYRKV